MKGFESLHMCGFLGMQHTNTLSERMTTLEKQNDNDTFEGHPDSTGYNNERDPPLSKVPVTISDTVSTKGMGNG